MSGTRFVLEYMIIITQHFQYKPGYWQTMLGNKDHVFQYKPGSWHTMLGNNNHVFQYKPGSWDNMLGDNDHNIWSLLLNIVCQEPGLY
jgi:hypothetical protein